MQEEKHWRQERSETTFTSDCGAADGRQRAGDSVLVEGVLAVVRESTTGYSVVVAGGGDVVVLCCVFWRVELMLEAGG